MHAATSELGVELYNVKRHGQVPTWAAHRGPIESEKFASCIYFLQRSQTPPVRKLKKLEKKRPPEWGGLKAFSDIIR